MDVDFTEKIIQEVRNRPILYLLNHPDYKNNMKKLQAWREIQRELNEEEKENISCPRCRKTFEHAQELMKEVKSIDRKIVMGICDRCTKKAQTIKKSFCVCDKIVKKFKSSNDEQKEDIKNYVKSGFQKVGSLFKDGTSLKKPQQIKTRVYSDPQNNQGLGSPAPGHEPGIEPMFNSETHKSDINLNAEMKETDLKTCYKTQSVTFLQPQPMETPFSLIPFESGSEKMVPRKSFIDSDNTFIDVQKLPKTSLKNREQEENFEDTPSMDAKKALKIRFDLSLRQMMKLDEDSRVRYSDTSVYETPKSKSWHKKPPKAKQILENVLKPKYTFLFPKVKEKGGKKKGIGVRSSQLVKVTREKLHLQAEENKRKADEDKKYAVKQKKLSEHKQYSEDNLEKKLVGEDKKRQADEDKKYAVKQKGVSEHKKYSEEDLEKKLVGEEKKQNKAKRDRTKEGTFEKDGEIFMESELKGKIAKESVGTKKERDTVDKEFDKAKKGSKLKPEQRDELLEKARNDFKSKPEQEDKIHELLQKTKKDLKPKPQQGDKIDEVLQKTKKDRSKPEGEKIGKLQKTEKDKIEVLEKTKQSVKEKSALAENSEKNDLKEKPKQQNMDDEDLITKALKAQKKKHGKIDETKEKGKQGVKEKLELTDSDKTAKKGGESLKSRTEQKNKIELLEKTKEGVKEKSAPAENGEKKDLKEKPKKKNMDDDDLRTKALKAQKTKSRTEQKNKIEVLEKTKEGVEEKSAPAENGEKTDLKEKPKQKNMDDDDLITKALKAQKKKHGKIDETKEKGKQGVKEKLELTDSDKTAKKGGETLKSRTEPKNKIEVLEKIKEDVKEKSAPVENGEKNDLKEKPKQKNMDDDDLITKALKAQKKKHGKIDETKEKGKQGVKEKLELTDSDKTAKKGGETLKSRTEQNKIEVLEKMKEGVEEKSAPALKSRKEKKNKISELENANKVKANADQQGEDAEKEEKLKMAQKEREKAAKEAADQLKLFERLRKENKKERAVKIKGTEIKKPVEFKMKDIKLYSSTVLKKKIIGLVKVKHGAMKKPHESSALVKYQHKCNHKVGLSSSTCPICHNSDLELDVLSLDNHINIPAEIITDMVKGEKIVKLNRRFEITKEPKVEPKYQKVFFARTTQPPKKIVQISEQVQKPILSSQVDAGKVEVESNKGILHYALSDRTFIEKGWTMLPTEKVVRKMNVYRMRPAHPEFDWFEHNKNKRLMTYDTGERLAEFDDNGRGRWYYRSGRLALDYYDAEETNAQQRFVIYSSGEPDERGRTHPITILATFDYLGNGIVFDHSGKIRLKYNQTEGVVLDRGIGPVSHWKWHTLNDPPVLQQVMIDTQLAHKDPTILNLGAPNDKRVKSDNEEMLAIEFDNFIKEKSKKLSQKFKPFQIKMKALKINEHFSLKVLDQATVYLIFRDGSTNLKQNIGMILDHQEIVDTDTAEVGEVSNSLERFPARTDSLAGLQRSVAYAQRYERQRSNREGRLRPAGPCASADQLTAAASPPMRLPFRTAPTGSSSTTGRCSGYCSRKPTNSLYYNTRLL